MEQKIISKSVLKRLPGYLAYLKNMPEGSPANISATALANALGMGEVQVRKDLAMVSDGGRPKVGYLRESLIDDIEQFLGYDNTTDAVLIGAGKLGLALMGYKGFNWRPLTRTPRWTLPMRGSPSIPCPGWRATAASTRC